MKDKTITLSLVFFLLIFFSNKTKAQIFAGNDTLICGAGNITLNATIAPFYGTNQYVYDTVPYGPEFYGGTPLYLWDDAISDTIIIPFDFCFFGQVFNECYVGSNGWLGFSSGQPTTYASATIPSQAISVPKNCIMGAWSDWNPSATSIYCNITGIAPNRKFVVSWIDCPLFSCSSFTGTFQIVLTETSNEICYHLTNKPICLGWAGGTSTQGLHNWNGSLAYCAPGRNSTIWETQLESSKFVPSDIVSPTQIQWFNLSGDVIGNGPTLTVNPNITTSYVAGIMSCTGILYTDNITITVNPTLNICDLIGTNIDCFNGNTGSIDITVSGGTQPYSYLWNNGETIEDISLLGAGNYLVTITDALNYSIIDSITLLETDELLASSVIADVTSYGAADGAIDLTISGGAPPYTFSWSNGDIVEDLYGLSSGNFTITIIDNNGCNLTESYEITEPPGPNLPNWSYTVTQTNHTILIQATTPITLNGVQISQGDYIGVFYDSLGTLVCGGYQIWQNTTTSIAAWGADLGNDGFAIGEQFKWKIWDESESIEYDANATYMPVPPMANQEFYAVNGLSGLASLYEVLSADSQEIILPQSWSYFSTYIIPTELSFDSIFMDVNSNLLILKDYFGQTYWPIYGINNIGNISICEGYQLKMAITDTIIISGFLTQPEFTNCNIPFGWSYFSYLRKTPASIINMLSNVVNDIEIVKNYFGQTYWPIYGLNLIGNMIPGEGYQVKMNNGATLTYPANSTNVSKENDLTTQAEHFINIKNTGSNMTLGIPKTAWKIQPSKGSEIGIFSPDNHREKLVGSAVYTGENLAISIWGNDELTEEIDGMIENNKFIIKIWNGENEEILEIETWLKGNEFYKTNKISVVEKLSTFNLLHSTCILFQNVPNPFSETTEISFYIPEKAFVEIELFNLIGEKIVTIQSQNYPGGNHSINFNKNDIYSGAYFYRLKLKGFSETKIMYLVD
ncbi:MAG: T9SS type A sorting domain-containing protein [Bacteroidetes bacterium]|jgi:hypothetical protein|nr:T9SS type A sorting domain-containing protein [Bacteroidota bacterium]MBT7144725.1 T9SS type A sorting domain-containing protein [Bacteroidota bacterium]MBT7491206.1 T9SS type A sorting domain-containing protein [Bacteroidota bacterium]